MWISFCLCLISDRVLCCIVFITPYSYKQGNPSCGGSALVKTYSKVGHHVHAGRRWDLNWLIRCSVDLNPAYIAMCHMCMLAFGQSLLLHSDVCSTYYNRIGWNKAAPMLYRGADKSLARPTSRCILFNEENISFDSSLVIYINSINIPPGPGVA